jgi:hypothetical protein
MTRWHFLFPDQRGWAALGVLAAAGVFLATQAQAFQGPIPRQLRIHNQALRATIEAARRRAEAGAQAPAPQQAISSGALAIPAGAVNAPASGRPAANPAPSQPARAMNPHALAIPIDVLRGGSRSLSFAATAVPRDPAFERYVDLAALGRAWDALDAAGVADGALALIEGERVLQRQHAGLSGADVAVVAARLAVERGDGDTLARLEKAAARSGHPKLVEQFAAVKLLGGKSRSAVPAAAIDVGTVSPEQYGAIVAVNRAALRARVTGNAEYILPLVDEAGDLRLPSGVPAAVQATLGERVISMCDGLPEEPSAGTGMLDVLAAESRGGSERPTEQPTEVTGGYG